MLYLGVAASLCTNNLCTSILYLYSCLDQKHKICMFVDDWLPHVTKMPALSMLLFIHVTQHYLHPYPHHPHPYIVDVNQTSLEWNCVLWCANALLCLFITVFSSLPFSEQDVKLFMQNFPQENVRVCLDIKQLRNRKTIQTCKAYHVRGSNVQDLAEAGNSYGVIQWFKQVCGNVHQSEALRNMKLRSLLLLN